MMTIEEINALVFDDNFELVLQRMTNEPYVIGTDINKTLYENLTMSNKPYLTDMQAEFEIYKNELLAIENERLRIADIELRWNVLTYNSTTLRSLYEVQNIAAWFRDLKLDTDHSFVESLLSEIENAHPAIQLQEEFKEALNDDLREGQIIDLLISKIRKLVSGYNKKNLLTTDQVNAFSAEFATIIAYINNNQPYAAKPLIEAVTGYDELKAKLLYLYDESGS